MSDSIWGNLSFMRDRLNTVFSADTAAPNTIYNINGSSKGHCAAVAYLIYKRFGGDLKSAKLEGYDSGNHWYNTLEMFDRLWDVDLTGDQYGFPGLQICGFGSLYDQCNPRIRLVEELNVETKARARILDQRADLHITYDYSI